MSLFDKGIQFIQELNHEITGAAKAIAQEIRNLSLQEIKQELIRPFADFFQEATDVFFSSPATENHLHLSLTFRIEGARQCGENYAVLGMKPFAFEHPQMAKACMESYNATLERMKTQTRVFDLSTKEDVWLPHNEAEALHERQINSIVLTREDKEQLAKEFAAINVQLGRQYTLEDVEKAPDRELAELLYREIRKLRESFSTS